MPVRADVGHGDDLDAPFRHCLVAAHPDHPPFRVERVERLAVAVGDALRIVEVQALPRIDDRDRFATPQERAAPVRVVAQVDVESRIRLVLVRGRRVVRRQVRPVAVTTVDVEQHAPGARALEVDGTEEMLGPLRCLELRERLLDLVQPVRMDRGVVAQVRG